MQFQTLLTLTLAAMVMAAPATPKSTKKRADVAGAVECVAEEAMDGVSCATACADDTLCIIKW